MHVDFISMHVILQLPWKSRVHKIGKNELNGKIKAAEDCENYLKIPVYSTRGGCRQIGLDKILL